MTNDEIRGFIDNAIQENEVMLFMKGTPHQPACGFSARTAGALNALGVKYAALDILPDPRIREELSGLSGWPTIPQLFVKGELVGGCGHRHGDVRVGRARRGARRRAASRRAGGARGAGPGPPARSASRTSWTETSVRTGQPGASARAARLRRVASALGVLARLALVALLLVGRQRPASASRPSARTARAGARCARPCARRPTSGLPLTPPRSCSSQSRYSRMRWESWITSSPCTSTGTQRWSVSSSTSGRSRFSAGHAHLVVLDAQRAQPARHLPAAADAVGAAPCSGRAWPRRQV